jgi:hypothetical protein
MMPTRESEANQVSVPFPTRTLALVQGAARDGAADAREAAERTWAATSRFVSRLVYTTCYSVSYGVVFPAVFLAHAIPSDNAAVRGLIDGARAAIDKVDQLRDTAREPSVSPETRVPAPV